jgi:hypothetical protein
MSPQPRGTAVEIETVSEDQAQKHIKETYAKPEAALAFFHGYIAQREKALKAFDAQVNKDQALAADFAKDPVGVLRERNLLGPLDVLHIDGLTHALLPWPFPFCHFEWRIQCSWVVEWRCITIFGFRFCWPVLVLRCRWVLKLVCNW